MRSQQPLLFVVRLKICLSSVQVLCVITEAPFNFYVFINMHYRSALFQKSNREDYREVTVVLNYYPPHAVGRHSRNGWIFPRARRKATLVSEWELGIRSALSSHPCVITR